MPKVSRQNLEDCDHDIAETYLKTTAQHLIKIRAALRTQSMPDVQKFSHRIGGTSAYLGLTAMASLLRKLERAASKGRAENALQLLARLNAEFTQLQGRVAPRVRLRYPPAP